MDHSLAGRNRLPPSDVDDAAPECREALTSFWDYLDGNCSPELAERLDAHFSKCVTCSRLRQFQERFFASLGEMRHRSPTPARLHDRVRRALAAERRRTGRVSPGAPRA